MDQIVDDRRTNWFWIDNEIVDHFGPQIGAYGLAVYAILARFADNKTRTAFPAVPTLAALSKLSRNTVISAIQCLENTQPPLITVQPGGGRNANTYILNDLAQVARDPVPTAPRALPPSMAAAAPSNGHYPTQPERFAPPTTTIVYDVDNGSRAPGDPQQSTTRAAAARQMDGSRAPHARQPRATRAAAARQVDGSRAPHAREQDLYNNTHTTRLIEKDDDDDAREHARAHDDNALSSSSSSSLSPSSPSLESSSFQPVVLQTWKDLENEYGVDLVRQAVAAAPDDKRNSLRYVAGILKNWRHEGADQRRNRRKRSDPFAYDAGETGEARAPDADPPAAAPPPPTPSPAWQTVVEQIALQVPKATALSLRNCIRGVRLENSTLIVEATDEQLAAWLENRLGRVIKGTWNHCHPDQPVMQIVFR